MVNNGGINMGPSRSRHVEKTDGQHHICQQS